MEENGKIVDPFWVEIELIMEEVKAQRIIENVRDQTDGGGDQTEETGAILKYFLQTISHIKNYLNLIYRVVFFNSIKSLKWIARGNVGGILMSSFNIFLIFFR